MTAMCLAAIYSFSWIDIGPAVTERAPKKTFDGLILSEPDAFSSQQKCQDAMMHKVLSAILGQSMRGSRRASTCTHCMRLHMYSCSLYVLTYAYQSYKYTGIPAFTSARQAEPGSV